MEESTDAKKEKYINKEIETTGIFTCEKQCYVQICLLRKKPKKK